MQLTPLTIWRSKIPLLALGVVTIAIGILAFTESEQHSHEVTPPDSERMFDDGTPDLSPSGFRIGTLAVALIDNLFSANQSRFGDVTQPTSGSGTSKISGSLTPDSSAAISKSSSQTAATNPTVDLGSTEESKIEAVDSSSSVSDGVSPLPADSVTTSTLGDVSTSSGSLIPRQSLSTNATAPVATTASTSTTTTSTSTTTTSTSTTTTSTTVPLSSSSPVTKEPAMDSEEPYASPTLYGQPYLADWPNLAMWERMAWCESRNTWDIDTGNGYFGGLQFALGSWQWMGGEGSPSDASKEEQIYRANLLWKFQGWNGWPGCKAYFGWTRWQTEE